MIDNAPSKQLSPEAVVEYASQELLPPERQATLQDYLDQLFQYGGMQFIRMLVRGVERLDPHKKAIRDSFLKDDIFENERKQLAVTLDMWIDFLSSPHKTDNREQVVTDCEKHINHKVTEYERRIVNNMSVIRNSIQKLETAYRTLGLFFANTNKEKVDFLSIINVDRSKLNDLSSNDSKTVIKELNSKYDKLDLRESYSLFVIPGYLNDFQTNNIDDWINVAYANKALFITDFQDCLQYDDLIYYLNKASLQGSKPIFSSAIVACNYILKRRKSEQAGEYDDLYIPASGALAGRMTDVENIPIAQGIAGKQFGRMEGVPSVRLDMTKAELSKLIDYGMVPVVEVSGQVYAFSNSTIYNGSVKELQEYPIVRVFNWVSKVLLQYCNDQAFTNWSSTVEENMKYEIGMFLNKKKNERLIDDFTVNDIHRDPQSGDVLVQVEIKPFFAARNFLIELKGKSELGKLSFHLEDQLS